MIELFPWLSDAWSRLAARRAALPHALLLRGRPGLGKTLLARRFAQGLLCEAPAADGAPCCECPACNWFAQGNHPDFRQVEPEILGAVVAAPGERDGPGRSDSLSKQIRIDQVRELQGFLAIGTHRGGARVVIVRPAEAMNAATANALLKSLEEPGPKTLFILVSSQPQRLLPTIRSRCQAIDVSMASREDALAWLRARQVKDPEAELAFAGAAPLAVLEQTDASDVRARLVDELGRRPFQPLAVADRCGTVEPPTVVDILQKWTHDLARSAAGLPVRYFPGHAAALRALSTATDRIALLRFGRDLSGARAMAQHPLNARLFVEDLFIRYAATQGNGHA
jgi:DNA polymerase-3 subunit delta'